MKRTFKAIQIFLDYYKLENRLPSKVEFDLAWYGRDRGRNSRYYWRVKKQFLELRGDNDGTLQRLD